MFILNQRLRDDTVEIISLNLSRILLMKDKSFPWLILVPEKEDIKEIYELTAKDRAILIEEISLASQISADLRQIAPGLGLHGAHAIENRTQRKGLGLPVCGLKKPLQNF